MLFEEVSRLEVHPPDHAIHFVVKMTVAEVLHDLLRSLDQLYAAAQEQH